MKKNNTKIIVSVLLLFILGLTACSSKSDQELNKNFSPLNNESISYYAKDSQYYWYYRDAFENLPIDTIPLSMGLDWYVSQYDDVYVGKEDFFYISAFDTPNISTNDLVKLYISSQDSLYYLKPFLDCYLLMDKNHSPSEEELKLIKETILYALDYYINGNDFIGTLK